MLRNYLVTALRNIRKNALASFITIIGFSVGIAGALFIFLYIQYEFSFDKYLAGHDRIYRVLVKATSSEGGEYLSPRVDYRIKNALMAQESGIESITQVNPLNGLLGYGERRFYEESEINAVDSSYLKVFSYPLAAGDRATALGKPMSIVLTGEKARKYFGDENPIGKTLSFTDYMIGDKVYYFTVTGVLAPLPANSSFKFGFLVQCPYEKYLDDVVEYYNSAYHINTSRKEIYSSCVIYARLKGNGSLDLFKKGLSRALDGISSAYLQYTYKSYRLTCESLDSMYLFSRIDTQSERRGNFLFILLLAGLGIIVIAIACINVINLTTARGMARAKEIGVRKSLGASRGELRSQCLVESILLSFISLWFALVIVELFLPSFAALIKRDLAIHYLRNPAYIVAILGITLAVGLLSGLYPAVYLSGFNVMHTLRGQRTPSSRRFREAMVVVQFVFSIGLFIATIVILREFRSMKDADPGFNAEGIVLARLDFPEVEAKLPAMKKAISGLPGILGVSASSFAAWREGEYVRDYPMTIHSKMRYCDVMVVDPDYLRIQGIGIAQGRDFDAEYADPELSQLIVNEAAQRRFGFAPDSFIMSSQIKGRVVGVARDFAYSFPSKRVRPLIMTTSSPFWINNAFGGRPVHLSRMLIKLCEGDRQRTLDGVASLWKDFTKGYSFDYAYAEAVMRAQQDDYYFSFEGILGISTALSFLLSGLGLFGLASFEVERRTKEVGIRKALGATSAQIVLHFVAGFARLIALANLIAWPFTFLLIRAVFTLIEYPRTLRIGPLVFLEAGIASLLVMAATVGTQTLRAARSNPVNTIRYE
jgi:putative ABC transport system permease protein